MSGILHKLLADDDEAGNLASQESTSSNDEGLKSHTRSISPPGKQTYVMIQNEVLTTATDCGGYAAGVSSVTDTRESEVVSPSEMQVDLLEKTRTWKNLQLKKLQFDSLKYHYVKMVGYTSWFNWYKRYDEVSDKKPIRIQDLPCECRLEEESNISDNTKQSCEEKEEKPTEQESTDEESNILLQSPIQKLAKHNNTCNAKRTSLYFSSIAEYFIGEKVDPEIFLYVPLPKEKYGEGSVDYEYYSLQENRKILILKLWEGLRTKLESWVTGMTDVDKIRYEYRNEFRIAKHLVLNNLLEDLVRPYESLACREERNSLRQYLSNQIPDRIDEDECRYLKLKYEYMELKERLAKEASSRGNERFFANALHFDYNVSYKDFENGENIIENIPSTSKDKSKQEIKNRMVGDQEIDKPKSESKKCNLEQETGESESRRKRVDSDLETDELESKRKRVDSDLETDELESKRKRVDSDMETDESGST